VQRMEERCTLYFSEDFKSCICAMRGEPEVLLQLQEWIHRKDRTIMKQLPNENEKFFESFQPVFGGLMNTLV